jgi:hypothetical protein
VQAFAQTAPAHAAHAQTVPVQALYPNNAQTAPAHAQVHLYDVDLSEQGGPVLQESRGTAPGHEVRTAAVVVHPCCPLPIFDWLVGHAVIGCMPWPS